jgi:pyrroline-5-carboxylate reductase
MNEKIGFIGAGNMGGALVRAVAPAAGPVNVAVYDPDTDKCERLARETGCVAAGSASVVASVCDFVFCCVKPNMMAAVVGEIAPALSERAAKGGRSVFVSIAAGVSVSSISDMLGAHGLRLPVIRLLPNTPISAGQGMTVMACGASVTDSDRETVKKLLSSGSRVMDLDEKLIDAATPVFSCAPAFVYMFIEALADGGVLSGLSRDKAQYLAAQAVLGAAAMVKDGAKHPGQLKDEVCSPGGATIAGVEALEKGGFRSAVISAVSEAYKKTGSLGK